MARIPAATASTANVHAAPLIRSSRPNITRTIPIESRTVRMGAVLVAESQVWRTTAKWRRVVVPQ